MVTPCFSDSPLRGSTNPPYPSRQGDGDPRRHPVAAAARGAAPTSSRAEQVDAGVTVVGVGGQRQIGIQADDGDVEHPGTLRQRHRPIPGATSQRRHVAFCAVMSDAQVRIEHDSLGEVEVPADALWQAQTQRADRQLPDLRDDCRAASSCRRWPS